MVFRVIVVLLSIFCVGADGFGAGNPKKLTIAVGLSLPPYVLNDGKDGLEIDGLKK